MSIDVEHDDLQIAIKQLKVKEEEIELIETLNELGSWELDLKTNKVVWSKQTYLNYGYEPYSIEPSLKFFMSKLVPSFIPHTQDIIQKVISTGERQSLECQIFHKDGSIRDVILRGQVIYDDNHTPLKIIGTTQDITELIKLQKENSSLSKLLEYSSNEIYIVDINTFEYLYVNKGACQALGYTSDEFLKMNIYDINPQLQEHHVKYIKQELLADGKYINKTIHQRKDGSTYHAQAYMHLLDYKGKDAYVIFDIDISKNVEDEKKLQMQRLQLQHQAHHDSLTGLPNRALFKDRLSQSAIIAKRHNTEFALLFIDLDQFKKINDSLGHHIGDEVLIETSKRLKNCVREEDTIARLGGDEFTIILKDIKSLQDVSKISQKIVDEMRKVITIDTHKLYISSSIGISLYPKDATSYNDLIRFADTAMYKAKDEGRNNYQFYTSEMTTLAFEKVVMDTSLRMAIKEEQFIVYYQPQVNLHTGAIAGMEALVRWSHPTLGIIPPSQFIPIAEENGLIVDIDKLVRKEAMLQFSEWYKNGLNPGVLSINLAMKQLNEKDFLPQLLETMKTIGFKAKWLELEITEGEIMADPELSIQKLNTASELGIELAIDDFGTGYSSLSYLKKLPLTKLKIDQSFIKELPDDDDDIAITKAIIALGRSLNLKLIAEGVEKQEQKEFLQENHCDFIQGYYYSPAVPKEEMSQLLKKQFN